MLIGFRVLILILLLCSISRGSTAQILDVYQGILFKNNCQFSQNFTRNNGIKSIKGTISTKNDLQPISSKGLILQYTFDRSGKLTEELKTIAMRRGRIDTAQNHFGYNESDLLIVKTEQYIKAYDIVRYTYNSDNLLNSITKLRGKASDSNLNKITETIVNREQCKWIINNDSINQIIFYNASEKPYKQQIEIFDRISLKVADKTTYIVTKKHNDITYKYNNKGQLIKIIDFSNVSIQRTLTRVFKYDDYGNLIQSKKFRNSKLSSTKEYIYDPETLLLSAQLNKDESTKSIKIIQYEYEYFKN